MTPMQFDFKPDGPLQTLLEKMAKAGWLNSATAISSKTTLGGADVNLNQDGITAMAHVLHMDIQLGGLTAQEAAVLVNLARLVADAGRGGR